MSKENSNIGKEAIYDARRLGVGKVLVLGFQHIFAMFGATVLVPALTGLDVATTLLFAGLGTLFFHFVTEGKIPAFLGSSFAFIAGYQMIAPNKEAELLPYACFGVACAGLLYLGLAALIKTFGAKKMMRFFPPIVTGPMIIAIGLSLAGSAINNCSSNWLVAFVAIAAVVICNIWGKGMVKIIPIIIGVGASVLAAVLLGAAGVEGIFDADKIQALKEADLLGLPIQMDRTVFAIFKDCDTNLLLNAMIGIMPLAIATMMEHIGDLSAISSTVGKKYLEEPGLHRSLIGDGVATTVASLFGAPANTTYGENTGVLALTKVFDPMVIRLAAVIAILFSFSPKFAALVSLMPTATIGGVSLILYGMISAVGIRNLIENQVDFTQSRNVIVAALMMVCALGFSGGLSFSVFGATITLSGLAIAALVGIILNAILPETDPNA